MLSCASNDPFLSKLEASLPGQIDCQGASFIDSLFSCVDSHLDSAPFPETILTDLAPFFEILEKSPELKSVHLASISYKMSLAAKQGGKKDIARNYLRRAYTYCPDTLAEKITYLDALLAEIDDQALQYPYLRARLELRKKILGPRATKVFVAYIELARNLSDLLEYQTAIQLLKEADSLNESSEETNEAVRSYLQNEIAINYYELGDFKTAKGYLEQDSRLTQGAEEVDEIMLFNLATCLIEENEAEKALEFLQTYYQSWLDNLPTDLDPRYAEKLYSNAFNQSLAWQRLRNFPSAHQALQKAIPWLPRAELGAAEQATYDMQKAELYLDEQQWSAARTWILKAWHSLGRAGEDLNALNHPLSGARGDWQQMADILFLWGTWYQEKWESGQKDLLNLREALKAYRHSLAYIRALRRSYERSSEDTYLNLSSFDLNQKIGRSVSCAALVMEQDPTADPLAVIQFMEENKATLFLEEIKREERLRTLGQSPGMMAAWQEEESTPVAVAPPAESLLNLSYVHDTLLTDSSMLLEFFWEKGEAIHGFAISRQQQHYFRHEIEAGWEPMLDSFLVSLETPSLSESVWWEFVRRSHTLYQQLLAPALTQMGEGIDHLIIIPDGPLASLPFRVLLPKVSDTTWTPRDYRTLPYLNRTHHINRLASIHSWRFSQQKYPAWQEPMTVLGMAYGMADSIRKLPGSLTEVAFLQARLRGEFAIEREASPDWLRTRANAHEIVHLGMHAQAKDGYPYLEFPGSMEAGSPVRLYPHQLRNFSFEAALAVLSACQSGQGILGGDEGIFHLARAFQQAGCQQVVMSLWSLEDRSTASIIPLFYEKMMEGFRPEKALQLSMNAYLEHVDVMATHPYYWAGFTFAGNGGALNFQKKESNQLITWMTVLLCLIGGIWIGNYLRKRTG